MGTNASTDEILIPAVMAVKVKKADDDDRTPLPRQVPARVCERHILCWSDESAFSSESINERTIIRPGYILYALSQLHGSSRKRLREAPAGNLCHGSGFIKLQVRSSVIFPGFFKSTSKSNIEQPDFLIRPPCLIGGWWRIAPCC